MLSFIVARSLTNVVSFFPIWPAGCDFAKSSLLNPRASRRAIARASPNAKAIVVEDVGARSNGQASSAAFITRLIFPALAIVD